MAMESERQGLPGQRQDPPASLWTIHDVAAYLRIHEKTVARWVRSGRLPCVRIGSRLRFDRQDVLRWVGAGKEGA
jgi:excisionase family DNA binding protein